MPIDLPSSSIAPCWCELSTVHVGATNVEALGVRRLVGAPRPGLADTPLVEVHESSGRFCCQSSLTAWFPQAIVIGLHVVCSGSKAVRELMVLQFPGHDSAGSSQHR